MYIYIYIYIYTHIYIYIYTQIIITIIIMMIMIIIMTIMIIMNMYIYIYIYTHIYSYIYIYIHAYICIERETYLCMVASALCFRKEPIRFDSFRFRNFRKIVVSVRFGFLFLAVVCFAGRCVYACDTLSAAVCLHTRCSFPLMAWYIVRL